MKNVFWGRKWGLYEILNILETFSLEYIYVYIDCCNLGTSKQVYNEEYFKERNIIILRSQFRCKNKRSHGDLINNFCNSTDLFLFLHTKTFE